jgi:transmembrane sensor
MVQDNIWTLISKKLSGEGNDAELRELERLLRENPELHYSVQIITDLWFSELKSNHDEAQEAFNRHLQRMESLSAEPIHPIEELSVENDLPDTRKRFFWPSLAASIMTAAILFCIRFFGSDTLPGKITAKKDELASSDQHINGKGSKAKLTLSDGTTVWLNAGSSLSYDSAFNKNIREVALTGEAFFDVAKNKNKPFIIHTSKINIKVLGTAFNVRSYATDKTTEASLIRGSIEVSFKDNPGRKIILKPNEKIVVDNDLTPGNVPTVPVSDNGKKTAALPAAMITKLTHQYKTGAIIETSWIDNKLIFQDESFDQIARQLERWYGASIVFNNDRLKENHLTGSFTNETLQQALDALKLTASFNYKTDKNNNVTIY